MTKVGLVVHGQPPELVGGTERLVAAQAEGMARAGEAVEVFSGSIEWRPEFEVVRDETGPVPIVRVHRHDLFFERWDKLHNPFVERAFLDWLDAWQPDLVHVHHWARLSTTLVQCASEAGVPVVVSLHDLFASCPRYHRVREDLQFCEVAASPDACRHCAPRWRFQGDGEIDASVARFAREMRRELECADALLAPTEGHARRVLGWLGMDRPVTIVPPASETQLSGAARPLGDRVASADEPLRVGSFGHLHVLKGIEVLLDAQAALAEPERVELHVWGEAPTPEAGAALVQRAAGRKVIWHGAYRPEQLSGVAIDAVVLPTLCAESYAFALDEACALGVPILASELGALADRATGRMQLFPRGDVAALARALTGLADDPAERGRLSGEPAPARLDMAGHLAGVGSVYASVLEGAGARPRQRPERRLDEREQAFALREAGLRELLRSEGWEDVVRRLQAENEALRRDAEAGSD